MFANGCFVTDGNHRFDDREPAGHVAGLHVEGADPPRRQLWCGANVVVTSGVTIGERCVIGANCVVTTDVPAGSIAAGAPARVLRTIAFAGAAS